MTDLLKKLAGRFAYTFGGYAVDTDSFFLTGLGLMDLKEDGKLTGSHRSSLLRLKGNDAITTGEYGIDGTLSMDGDGTGLAKVSFRKTKPGKTGDSDADFYVILGGDLDHLWFISAGGKRAGDNDPTSELTRIEAVRMKPIAS